jgi:hypothetical protein
MTNSEINTIRMRMASEVDHGQGKINKIAATVSLLKRSRCTTPQRQSYSQDVSTANDCPKKSLIPVKGQG